MINILLQHYFTGVCIQIIAAGQSAVIIIIEAGGDTVRIGNCRHTVQRNVFVGSNACIGKQFS